MIYKGIEITATKNSWSGLWGASYTLPGEDDSHTGYFAPDEQVAINYAKRQIDRALEALEAEQEEMMDIPTDWGVADHDSPLEFGDNCTNINAGWSTCPICEREWLVTPLDDCFVPDCGCYGYGIGADNQKRPCENCGLLHAFNCKKSRIYKEEMEARG